MNKNVLLTITLVMILHRFERSPYKNDAKYEILVKFNLSNYKFFGIVSSGMEQTQWNI